MAEKGKSYETRDVGLLLLRIGIGGMMIYHGLPKLLGGPHVLEAVGKAIANFGVTSGFVWWGLAAALAEFVGGIAIVLGLFTRLFCAFLVIDMIVAVTWHLKGGMGFAKAAQAVEMGVVFFSLLFIGAGELAVGRMMKCPLCR